MNTRTKSVPERNARFFCSWSGGKDSCLALHRACKAGAKPAYLLTMLSEDGVRSRSHGLRRDVIEAQAACLGIPWLARRAAWSEYESFFVKALHEVRKEGIEAGVFGDIDFAPHLEWEDRICGQTGTVAYLPLWQYDRLDLLHEFLSLGYKAVIVTVKEDKLGKEFLGRTLDQDIVKEFQKAGIDACGESGEYHTLVVDGPLFSRPLLLEKGAVSEHSGHCSLDLRLRS